MRKTILITGSTNGIGYETATALARLGHNIILHGRSMEKLKCTKEHILTLKGGGLIESYHADLSSIAEVERLTDSIIEEHANLDVLINNAGVYSDSNQMTPDGLDIRFAVNAIAPFLLTQRLLPLLGPSSRVINLSSAAQSTVNPNALMGRIRLPDGEAYSQSKLALTMWSRNIALSIQSEGPHIIAVNPGSLLGTSMVKNAFGIDGGDVAKGVEILVRAALENGFSAESGQYYDNDKEQFTIPHPDVVDSEKLQSVTRIIETISKSGKKS